MHNWNTLSKWTNIWHSYEKGTIIDQRLSDFIENIQSNWKNIDFKKLSDAWFNDTIYGTKETLWNNVKNTNIIIEDNNYLKAFKSDYLRIFWTLKDNLSTSKIRQIISWIKIDKNLLNEKWEINFIWKAIEWHQYHNTLWEVKTETIKIKTKDWKEIEVTFAKAIGKDNKENLMWVENIKFSNAWISNYWIPSEIINWWLLTTKPIEYYFQTPHSIAKVGESNSNTSMFNLVWDQQKRHFNNYRKESVTYHPATEIIWDDYVDIRLFIQDNPLIVQYKKFSKKNEVIKFNDENAQLLITKDNYREFIRQYDYFEYALLRNSNPNLKLPFLKREKIVWGIALYVVANVLYISYSEENDEWIISKQNVNIWELETIKELGNKEKIIQNNKNDNNIINDKQYNSELNYSRLLGPETTAKDILNKYLSWWKVDKILLNKTIQYAIWVSIWEKLVIDWIIWPVSQSAIRKFQKLDDLNVDWIPWKKTIEQLVNRWWEMSI
jgi:hypothetical protein